MDDKHYEELVKYIVEKSKPNDILCQVAEEASELAQAALKLRRATGEGQFTPVTPEEARANFDEEFADIIVCMCVYGKQTYPNLDDHDDWLDRICDEIVAKKLQRWSDRLHDMNKEEKA